MLTKMKTLKERCKEENCELWEIALEDEIKNTGKSEEEIWDRLQRTLDVMKKSAQAALETEVISVTGMTGEMLRACTIISSRENLSLAKPQLLPWLWPFLHQK